MNRNEILNAHERALIFETEWKRVSRVIGRIAFDHETRVQAFVQNSELQAGRAIREEIQALLAFTREQVVSHGQRPGGNLNIDVARIGADRELILNTTEGTLHLVDHALNSMSEPLSDEYWFRYGQHIQGILGPRVMIPLIQEERRPSQ